MGSAIAGLTPLDAGQLVQISLDDMRRMSVPELVAFAHQLGVDVHKVEAERGKLLTEIMNYAEDA